MVYLLILSFLPMIHLFSAILDSVITTLELNKDLARLKQWAFLWKMSFNLDINNQDQEVIFSRKLKKVCYIPFRFNNSNVSQASSKKYLGLMYGNTSTFDEQLKDE